VKGTTTNNIVTKMITHQTFFACYLFLFLALISTCLGFVTVPAAGLEDRGLLRGSSIKRNQNETIEHYLPAQTISSISLSATSSIVSFSYQYFTGKTTKYYGTLTNAPTTAMTIYLWVTTSTVGTYIATMGRTSSSIDGEFIFGLNIVGEPWYFDWSSANKYCINITASGYSVTNNQRTFVAFVKSFNIGYLYINGQRVKQMTASSTVTLNNLAFNVGNDYRDNNKYFVGTMDNFNLYNYAMSASEILTAYQSALPTLTPTRTPTRQPTFVPTRVPTTKSPTKLPTRIPTPFPTHQPTFVPTQIPTQVPSPTPTRGPTLRPSPMPTRMPTYLPTRMPTQAPTYDTNLVSFSSKTFPTSSPVYYSSFTLPPKTALTLYTWIATTKKSTFIASMGRTASNIDGEFIFGINSAGELWYMDWSTGCQNCITIDITASGYSVTNGQRTFVAVVKSSNIGYLYINGQLIKQTTGKGTVTITNLAFNVGYDIRDNGSYFEGTMDNFNFYNYAFSSSQIWLLINRFHPHKDLHGFQPLCQPLTPHIDRHLSRLNSHLVYHLVHQALNLQGNLPVNQPFSQRLNQVVSHHNNQFQHYPHCNHQVNLQICHHPNLRPCRHHNQPFKKSTLLLVVSMLQL
jgi:hypothetical protein